MFVDSYVTRSGPYAVTTVGPMVEVNLNRSQRRDLINNVCMFVTKMAVGIEMKFGTEVDCGLD